MTTPRDDIAGLVIAELVDEIKDRRSHPAYPHHLDDLLDEAATQLAALSARVKELERDAEAFQCHEQTLRDNGISSHSEAVVRVVDAEARALRAEQERDEEEQRGDEATRRMTDLAKQVCRLQQERDEWKQAANWWMDDSLRRRLASGPEKENK